MSLFKLTVTRNPSSAVRCFLGAGVPAEKMKTGKSSSIEDFIVNTVLSQVLWNKFSGVT